MLLLLVVIGLTWELNLDLLGNKCVDMSGCCLLCDGMSISALLDTESECNQVGSRSHKGHVEGIFRVEVNGIGSSLGA